MTHTPPTPEELTHAEEELHARPGIHPGWTLALVSIALFMVTLDNLVVGVALPSIRKDLGGGLESLEWTVNAYTLAYAVLLMPAAAIGDRFGRKRMFIIGLALFTASSLAAALAPDINFLVFARALQGFGAAIVTPLTLTLLAEAFPGDKRGLALGIWSGVSGLGVASGPVVGGAVIDGAGSWQWIFGINIPIGIAVIALASWKLIESRGEERSLDIPGILLAGLGLLGATYAIVRGEADGWGTVGILVPLIGGVLLLIGFVLWEIRAPEPMLPMRFFKSRGFTATNIVSFAMFFGVFGSIFYLSQFFQTGQGLSPLESGIRTLPWTAMPIVVAPLAGILSDKIGARPLLTLGLAMQAVAIYWLAQISEPTVPYVDLLPAFMICGAGMAMVFAPAANAVLASVRQSESGQASGATNAIREVGGVMGVSMLGVLFAANGSYGTPPTFADAPQQYTDGVVAALPLGAAVLAIGAIAALFVPSLAQMRATAEELAAEDGITPGSPAPPAVG